MCKKYRVKKKKKKKKQTNKKGFPTNLSNVGGNNVVAHDIVRLADGANQHSGVDIQHLCEEKQWLIITVSMKKGFEKKKGEKQSKKQKK